MKAVQLLINSYLPPELRDYSREYDSQGLGDLMAAVAMDHPEKYEDISKKVSDAGRNASYSQGETLHLGDMLPVIDKGKIFAEMDKELAASKKEDPEGYKDNRFSIWQRYADLIEKATMKAALKGGNNLAYSVASGARGKSEQLRMMLSAPGLYTDYKDDPLPIFARHSFAEGLRPAEYLAGAFGARKAVIATKVCLLQGTLVRMADGSVKPIEDIVAGDMVVGSDAEGRTRSVQVTGKFYQGLQEVWEYKLSFSNSKRVYYTLCATENHKILMTDASLRAKDCSQYYRGEDTKSVLPICQLGGSRRKAVLPTAGDWAGGRSEEWASFLGLVLGDGCAKSLGTTLSCADQLLIEHIEPYLKELGLKVRKAYGDNFTWRISTDDSNPHMNGCIQKVVQGFVPGQMVKLKEVLTRYNLRNKYSWEKSLPEDIWGWDDASILRLISAYFACDGCVYENTQASGRQKVSVSFASTSKDLLSGVKTLLQVRFGINSGAVDVHTKGGFGSGINTRNHKLYVFSIGSATAVKLFAELMADLTPGVKRERLTRLANSINLKQSNPFSKASLKSKSYMGLLPCWDIAVDNEDHLFVLHNGLIVSNSTAKGGDFSKILTQAGANLTVTTNDCGTANGIDLDADDESLKGRVLAMPVAGMTAGTVLDKKSIAHLRKSDAKKVVCRSALTCEQHPGICSKCVGAFYNGGKFPKIGDSIGITASQSIGEPVTQGALNCLAIHTKVRMADYSVREIQDINPGELVLGSDKQGRTFPVEVLSTWDQGIQTVKERTYKLAPTRQEVSVTCTDIHNILQCTYYTNCQNEAFNAVSRKMPANVSKGQPSAVLPVSHTTRPDLHHEPLALLLGYYAGDGNRWRAGETIKVSSACGNTIEDLEESIEGMHITKCASSYDWAVALDKDATPHNVLGRCATGLRNPLKQRVRDFGWEGVYCHEKVPPQEMWGWSQKSLVRFISGFVSADGSVYRNKQLAPGVSFASTSVPMLDMLKEILAVRFCIYSSAITGTAKAVASSIRNNDQCQFTITRRDQLKKFSQVFSAYIPGGKGDKLVSYLEEAPKSYFESSPFYKAKRVREGDASKVHCYDISVDHEDQLFVLANGLIVSNTKHSGGVSSSKRSYSGFDVINQIVQSPDNFPDRAAVSEVDGRVDSITEAAQGGTIVTVGNEEHYVPQGYQVSVSVGDRVESGDQLADGIVDPGDIVRLRGLGEGRRFYSDRLRQALDDSGMWASPRNTEIVARAAIDHVVIEDPEGIGPYMPDDMISYNQLQRTYTPPADTARKSVSDAHGNFLQVPVLHYSIGTRITPSISKRLSNVGINQVHVTDKAPAMRSDMVRLRTAAHSNPDWLASMHTSYLKSQLTSSAVRGDTTDVQKNVHFAPRLAIGTDFGKNIETSGEF